MGSNFKNYAFASSDDLLGVFMLIILGLIAVYIGYKAFLYYMDRRKWSWFLQLCKEKKMNQKEVSYLKNVVMRKKLSARTNYMVRSIRSIFTARSRENCFGMMNQSIKRPGVRLVFSGNN